MGRYTKHSKFLSYVLRHHPEELGLELDDAGWAPVADLLERAARRDETWTRDLLTAVVETNSKRRFEFSPDGTQIRARQGHSVEVDLGYEPVTPPDVLFHGTVEKSLTSILEEGLRPMSRHHVHLSPDAETAKVVGSRRGKPVVLRIAAREMAEAGHTFMRTANDVWLVDVVPPQFVHLGADQVIREASVADAEGVARIQVAGWKNAYRGIMPNALLDQMSVEARTTRWTENLGDVDSPAVTLVLLRSGEYVGFGSYGPCRDPDANDDTYEIWAIYVDPPSWGSGAGRDLLLECLRGCRQAGANTASLWVLRDNERARRFYERAGFEPDGETKFYERGEERIPEVRYVTSV